MTGTYLRRRPEPHECTLPSAHDLGVGTVWRCDSWPR